MESILIVLPDLYYGGAEKQFRYLIDGLSNYSRLKLIVCVEQAYGSKLEQQADEFIRNHGNVKFIKCKGLSVTSGEIKKLSGVFKLIPIIRKIVKDYQIETILGYGALYSGAIKWIRKKGCRIILGERCDGHYNNPLTKYSTKYADMVIANSELAKEYMESIGYNNVFCIKNGISVQEDEIIRDKHEEFCILVPGRISHQKNQIQIIKAVSYIKDFAIKVLFCGEIQDEKYYEECKKCIQENNLQGKAEILGVVSNMKECYQSADLVILASYYEGTPNVLLESFVYKCMCIASNIDANKDVIRNNRFLFELGDDKDLYDKIQEVRRLSDIEKKQIVDDNCKYVRENYSIEKMVESYIDLLNLSV